MKSGRIPSRAITASSSWDAHHGPSRARLHIQRKGSYIGAWSAGYNNRKQWIRVYFRKAVILLAIATQGRSDSSQWVTRYYLTYSFDGVHFVPYLCGKVRELYLQNWSLFSKERHCFWVQNVILMINFDLS